MFWWLNFNPQMNGWTVNWPWSGAVTQDIVSGLLAAHGRQLGMLTDLVDEMAGKLGDGQLTERGRLALGQLNDYKARIERIRDEELQRLVPQDAEAAGRLLDALLVRHPQLSQPRSLPSPR